MASLFNCFKTNQEHEVDYEPYSALDNMSPAEDDDQVLKLNTPTQSITLTLTAQALVVLCKAKGE